MKNRFSDAENYKEKVQREKRGRKNMLDIEGRHWRFNKWIINISEKENRTEEREITLEDKKTFEH